VQTDLRIPLGAVLIAALAMTGCGGSTAPTQSSPASAAASVPSADAASAADVAEDFSSAADANAAATYCSHTGGMLQMRDAVYGTNNPPAQQLRLTGRHAFCRYLSAKDGSRIYVFLRTLYSTRPTLAALAYYAQVPLANAHCPGGANPASCYCTYLGGSDQFGGTNFAGGAWVRANDQYDTNLEACIFPDLSSIDSWGLAYHSANIIRGVNLAKVLRYQHTNT